MKHLIHTALLLTVTSFFTVGCTDAIVAAAIDEIKENIDDNVDEIEEEVSLDNLTLLKEGNNFSLEWIKKDTEFNEVTYRDQEDFREAIMEGSTAITRRYDCAFSEDAGESVQYTCIGLGTPGPDNDSVDGEILLNFQKDTDYAFLVDGELIYNILSYSDDTLTINGE